MLAQYPTHHLVLWVCAPHLLVGVKEVKYVGKMLCYNFSCCGYVYVRYLYVYIDKRHRFIDNHGDIVTKPGCEKKNISLARLNA